MAGADGGGVWAVWADAVAVTRLALTNATAAAMWAFIRSFLQVITN
jgi:hypothetical protein